MAPGREHRGGAEQGAKLGAASIRHLLLFRDLCRSVAWYIVSRSCHLLLVTWPTIATCPRGKRRGWALARGVVEFLRGVKKAVDKTFASQYATVTEPTLDPSKSRCNWNKSGDLGKAAESKRQTLWLHLAPSLLRKGATIRETDASSLPSSASPP